MKASSRKLSLTFHALKKLLAQGGHVTSVGDEGGYAPNLTTAEEVLDLLVRSIERANYTPGRDISLSMDPATSELYHAGRYEFRKSGQPTRTTAEMIALLERLVDDYPAVFIEDGLAEHDWDGWEALTRQHGSRVLLVGDDIFVTNPAIIREGIARKVGIALASGGCRDVRCRSAGTTGAASATICPPPSASPPPHRGEIPGKAATGRPLT